MAVIPARTYSNITPEKWQRIKANAAVYDVKIESDKGETRAYGAEIKWEWTAPKLVITVLDGGFLSEYMILNYLDSIVKPA